MLAFANGDRRALKDLLSSEVYDSFETVIKDREKGADGSTVCFPDRQGRAGQRKPMTARRN